MDQYPAKDSLEPESLKTCQLHGCGKCFSKFKGLEQHLHSAHGIPTHILHTHWIHHAFLRERRGGDDKQLGDQEAEYVDLAYDQGGAVDELHFRCKKCNGKVLHKQTCLQHMLQKHDLPKGTVQTWLTHKDGEKFRKLKRGSGEGVPEDRLYLAAAMHRHLVSQKPRPAECVDRPPATFLKPAPKYIASSGAPSSGHMSTELQEFRSSIDGLAKAFEAAAQRVGGVKRKRGKGELEVLGPEASINAKAAAWTTFEEEPDDARRYAWPLTSDISFSFDDFRTYLLKTKVMKEVSADAHVQKMQYFCGMWDFAGDDVHVDDVLLLGLLCNTYKSSLLAQFLELPILSPSLPTTRNLCAALCHYCNFLDLLCGKSKFKVAARTLAQLKAELLDPLRAKVHKERQAAAFRKGEWDAQRLQNLPPLPVLQKAIQETMLDLDTLWELHRDDAELKWQLKRAANVMMLGLTYTNSYAGRPGEWEELTRARVVEFLEGGGDVLVMHEHKTDKTFGKLGRFVPPGNVVAMQKVLDLHSTDCHLFLDPPKAGTKHVNAAELLKKWGHVYTPGHQHPGPTLQRKYFHTEAADEGNSGKAFQALCDMDGHSKKTGRSHYVVPNPKADAKVAAAVYKNFAGEPVAWPSEMDLADGRSRSMKRINACFFRSSKDVSTDDSDDDDDGDDNCHEVQVEAPDGEACLAGELLGLKETAQAKAAQAEGQDTSQQSAQAATGSNSQSEFAVPEGNLKMKSKDLSEGERLFISTMAEKIMGKTWSIGARNLPVLVVRNIRNVGLERGHLPEWVTENIIKHVAKTCPTDDLA